MYPITLLASDDLLGNPFTVIEPLYLRNPIMDFMMVLLPAPLGPRSTVRLPESRVKETSLHAMLFPYFFVTWSTTSILFSPQNLSDKNSNIQRLPYYGEKEYSYKEIVNSYGVLGWSMEYLPNSALELFYMNQLGFIKDFENNYRIISNDDKVLINVMNDDFPNIKFKIDGVSNDTKIVIPRIYYLGYVLSDSKNNKYKLYESNNGFLETKVRNNGIYILKYSGTIYDKISRIIRLVTIFIVVIGGVKLWKRKV